jgi:cell pole-organizing protein PopZ
MRAMSQAAKVQEPSMEEILASIRRIIADDEVKPAPPPPLRMPEGQSASAAGEVAASSVSPPSRLSAAETAAAREPLPMAQNDIDAMLAGFEAQAPEGEPTPQAPGPTEERADVLELTAAMEAPANISPARTFRTIEGGSDMMFAETAHEPARPREAASVRPPIHEAEQRPLLSNHATAAVSAAFGTLAHTVLAQNARTLDDLVQEMLRPMLKSWLDDNLPTIVERLVRAEIERVSRGRG